MIMEAIDEEKIAESPTKPENGDEAPESSAQGLTTAGANVMSAKLAQRIIK